MDPDPPQNVMDPQRWLQAAKREKSLYTVQAGCRREW